MAFFIKNYYIAKLHQTDIYICQFDVIIILYEVIRSSLKSITVIIIGAVSGIIAAFFIALIN